ncbi:unnamed protein product [Prorocentrum cordatum]|uniref:phosphopyruvate hydratase n=1 Tax=Prorocentrum cordatum TaxID=2364126 RepID=A0ABN9RDG4_9DINO|nr:unnamed protein product [Polarella glacialis]
MPGGRLCRQGGAPPESSSRRTPCLPAHEGLRRLPRAEGTAADNLDFKKPAGEQDPKNLKAGSDLVDWWVDLCGRYPVVILEDPCDENDFDNHAALTAKVGDKVEIVGDDLYCTNPKIVAKGVEKKATNAMLLKVNQIGSISEAIEAYKLCVENSWGVFCSHRSGETEDHFLADLTVALGTGHLKTGAPCRSERNCKYNQLLRIEEDAGKVSVHIQCVLDYIQYPVHIQCPYQVRPYPAAPQGRGALDMDKNRASRGQIYPYPVRLRFLGKGARNSTLQWI